MSENESIQGSSSSLTLAINILALICFNFLSRCICINNLGDNSICLFFKR